MVRRIVIFVFTLLVLTLIIAAVNSLMCGDDNRTPDNNPQDIAYAAVEALGSRDADRVCQYFVGESYHLMRAGLLDFFSKYRVVGVKNIQVTVINEGDSIARALIEYDLEYGAYEILDTIHISRKVQLIKQQGQWYLNEKI